MPIPDSMPVSRPILIALGGAVLAMVAFLASSAMRGGEETSAPLPERPKAVETKVAKSKPGTSAAQAAKPEGSSARSRSSEAKAPRVGKANGAAASTDAPARVRRAVSRGRTVVLFFYQRGGADDGATANAVAKLRGRRGLAVFTAPVARLGDFRAVTGRLGISQAPAVVIVGRKGKDNKARVVEGFVDPQTLAQEVADTR